MNDDHAPPGGRRGESAMRYRAERQLTAPGEALRLEAAELPSSGARAAAVGEGGLLLTPGRWLVSLRCDAEGEGALGAALRLNGAPLSFAQTLVSGAGRRNLSLQLILPLTGEGLLEGINNTKTPAVYANAVLTAVYLERDR